MDVRKRLTIGFFIGMIAISVASLSFSVAWYASSNFLTVAPIDISIQTDRELKISTKNEEQYFKNGLSLDDGDLAYIGVFAPVSTISSQEWISLRADTPVFYDCARTWSSHLPPEKDIIRKDDYYYYSQDFYIYADDDVFVTLDTEKTFIDANEDYNKEQVPTIKKEHPELSENEIMEKLNNLVKAMRFSILVPDVDNYAYYVIDPNKAENDEEVLFGGVLDNSKTLTYDTYRLNGEEYETVYGDVNDRSLIVYDDELADDIVYQGESSAFNATHKAGTHPFNYEKSVANGMEFAKEQSISLDDLKNNPNLIKIPVDRGYSHTRKIIVSIYIEGWDLRSINSTMGASFLSNMSFKILRENPK